MLHTLHQSLKQHPCVCEFFFFKFEVNDTKFLIPLNIVLKYKVLESSMRNLCVNEMCIALHERSAHISVLLLS